MSRTELAEGGVVTLAKACEITSLSRAKLYHMIAQGKLPFVKLTPRRRAIPRAALTQLLADGLVTPPELAAAGA